MTVFEFSVAVIEGDRQTTDRARRDQSHPALRDVSRPLVVNEPREEMRHSGAEGTLNLIRGRFWSESQQDLKNFLSHVFQVMKFQIDRQQ